MSFENIDEYTVMLAEAYAKDAYHKGYEQGKKDAIKHGYWIQSSGTEYLEVSCSECGYKVNYFWSGWQDALYCPKCGARMDGEA